MIYHFSFELVYIIGVPGWKDNVQIVRDFLSRLAKS